MIAGASILKNAGPFRATSIRLLSDLLELARATGNQKLLELDEATELRGASFIVVLQGALRLRAPAGRRLPRRN